LGKSFPFGKKAISQKFGKDGAVIDGENGRFRGPEKTCDNITFHSENCHVRYCRYHFSYNFAKKGESIWPTLPMIS
jgi:hypothetical protein